MVSIQHSPFPHLNAVLSIWTKRYHQPLKTLPCKHTSAKSTICMHAHYWTTIDHPPCIAWESDDEHPTWLNLNWNCEGSEIKITIKCKGIKHGKRSKWESIKSGRVQRQMTEHEATEQRTGVNWFNSRMSATAASSQMQRCRVWIVSLTDLAVAEMYWTTISRLVLRSFSRRGALRSSFRFMSSWR